MLVWHATWVLRKTIDWWHNGHYKCYTKVKYYIHKGKNDNASISLRAGHVTIIDNPANENVILQATMCPKTTYASYINVCNCSWRGVSILYTPCRQVDFTKHSYMYFSGCLTYCNYCTSSQRKELSPIIKWLGLQSFFDIEIWTKEWFSLTSLANFCSN